MAYAQHRTTSGGTSRWYAIYFTAGWGQRSGGGFSTKRDAERAAIKLEQQAAVGTLADASRGKLTFAGYVERYYWPAAQHLESTTLAAIPIEPGQSLPAALRAAAYEQDRRIDGAGLGQ